MKPALTRTTILAISAASIALALVVSGCAAPTPASPVSGQSSAPLSDPATSTPATPTATPTPVSIPATSTPAAATSTSSLTHQAQVDFGKPVGDSYLQTLLDKYEAKMVAAYMTTGGFFGAHRVATPTDPVTFIAQARVETLGVFTSGSGGGITTRAGDFVGSHTAQDLEDDSEIRKRAESLLELYSQLESARSDVAGSGPLIHAVEVYSSEAQLRLLGQEDDVVGFEIAPMGSQVYWSRPPLVDAATGQTATAAGTGTTGITATSQELYDRLSTLAER